MTAHRPGDAPLLIPLDPPASAPSAPSAPRRLRTAGLGLCVAAGLGAGVGLRLHTHPNPGLWAAPLHAVQEARLAAHHELWATIAAIEALGDLGDLASLGEAALPSGGTIPEQIEALGDAAWALFDATQTLMWTLLHPATLLAVEPASLGVGNGLSTSPIGRQAPPARPKPASTH